MQTRTLFRQAILVGSLLASVIAFAWWQRPESRLVSIGDRQLAVNCSGEAFDSPTIIFMAGSGRPAKDWSRVQSETIKFARACSYDVAGLGASDKVDQQQSADAVVKDLHLLMEASGERPPYVLVAHSIAGIYARNFTSRFPKDVAGLIFVDSSHEEQAWRLQVLRPIEGALGPQTASKGYFTQHGQQLTWRTDVPLVVLARGQPLPKSAAPGLTQEELAAWESIWQELQADLSARSTQGELRHAKDSGHMIPREDPAIVVQAIRDIYDRVINLD